MEAYHLLMGRIRASAVDSETDNHAMDVRSSVVASGGARTQRRFRGPRSMTGWDSWDVLSQYPAGRVRVIGLLQAVDSSCVDGGLSFAGSRRTPAQSRRLRGTQP